MKLSSFRTGVSLLVLVGLLTAAALRPNCAFAQAVASAEIRGLVLDSSGAVVPGAQVTATQTETDRVRSTLSGTDGSYVLPNLPVGPYRLEVSKPAFTSYVQSGIVLQVGNNVQINVTLQVGPMTQKVQVSANATMVEEQDTSISQVIDQRRIVALPLNGRQATDLILLSGGAALAPTAGKFTTTHDYPTAVAISVGGDQGNANNYLLDGSDHRDSHSNVNLPFPFPDALQEFNVQTGELSARNGLQGGALINVVTKSGTNQLHGNLFEFLRNGNVNARNFFAADQDTLKRNQFGGTIGGSIRRDKIFFFGGYQGTRERTAPADQTAFVPTAAALNGDFSALESAACQSSGKVQSIIDPATGQPFPNNFVDPSRFSKPALALQKFVPVSSDPCGKLLFSIPNPNDEDQFITREDWQLRPNLSIFGRYFLTDFRNPPVFKDSILTTTRSGLLQRAQAVALGVQWTLSPNLINASHVSFSRLAVTRGVAPDIPGPVLLGVKMFNLVPNYIDLSVSNHFGAGGGSNAPSIFVRNQWQFADDMDWIRDRHHISFGVSAISVQMNERNVQRGNGTFSFNGSITNDPLVDFLLGKPNSVIQQSLAEVGLRERYIGLYFQDNIQVNRRLNMNLGVRWEPSLPEHDVQGRGVHFSLLDFFTGKTSPRFPNAPPGLSFPGDPGTNRATVSSRYLDFAPRFGLAWDPTGSGKMSIRAAYGIFFDQPESFTARDWANAAPYGNQINLIAPTGGFDEPFRDFPGGNPFPFPPPNVNSPFPQQAAYINFPRDLHHPYEQKWSLSVQRQFRRDWLVGATYLGEKGTHLRAAFQANPAQFIPGATLSNTNQRRFLFLSDPAKGAFFSSIPTLDDGDNTNYNGVKLAVEHRFNNHFTLLSSYTYSHCLQDAEPIGNRLSGVTYQNPFNRNADYGNCDFDLRHNFVSSFVSTTPRFRNRAMNVVLGNWESSFSITAHSGFFFTPITGTDACLCGVGQDRPNVLRDPRIKDSTNPLQRFDRNAFTPNAPGTFGNAGYNSLPGPDFFKVDLGLTRSFKIRESQRLALRFEFFNVMNHTNFANPVANLRSSTFGTILSALDPRIIQFALKYRF